MIHSQLKGHVLLKSETGHWPIPLKKKKKRRRRKRRKRKKTWPRHSSSG
jgi:hypothetical protein